MTLVNCTVSGNGLDLRDRNNPQPAEQGGGLWNRPGATLSMTNCTVSGNLANNGGGLKNDDGATATLINCTVSGNRAGLGAIGSIVVAGVESALGYLTMYNSIVAGNFYGTNPSNLTSGDGFLFPAMVGDHNLIDIDAKLGPLGDYGGPTETMMPATDSPAINAGTASVATPGVTVPTTDQAGFARVGLPDIGAVEGIYSLVVTTTFTNRGSDPGQVSLAAAVNRANVDLGPNTVQFSSLFDEPQIVLGSDPITVTDPATTTIDGRGRLTIRGGTVRVKLGSLALSNVTLDGGGHNHAVRNFGGTAALSGVTITGFNAGRIEGDADSVIRNGGRDDTIPVVDPYTGTPNIRAFGGTMTLTGCTIRDNVGRHAIQNERTFEGPPQVASLTIADCTIRGNDSYKGTVANDDVLTMTDSTISDNEAAAFGGGVANFGTATLTGCTISGNTAFTLGGGIANLFGGMLTMTNCTVSGNTAGFGPGNLGLPVFFPDGTSINIRGGGGVFNAASATLVNCTVSGNAAGNLQGVPVDDEDPDEPGPGGGLLNLGTATLTNTIVAGNSAIDGGPDVDSTDRSGLPQVSLVSQGHNLIGITDGSSGWAATDRTGTAALPLDALLAALGDYGGKTQTRPLLPGSPAIDAGDPAAMAGIGDVPEFDQRGAPFTRVFDGDPPGDIAIDIGAFELQPLPPAFLGDYNQNGEVDAADYVVWRKTLGSAVAPYSGADGDGDGLVDQDDYGVWRAHFGETVGAGAGGELRVESQESRADAEVMGAELATANHRQGAGSGTSAAIALAEPVAHVSQPPALPGAVGVAVGMVGGSRENHALRPRLREVPPARRDDALVAWLASRAADERRDDGGSFARSMDHKSAEASPDTVDAVFERLSLDV
jgi:hypothetical protein